MFLSKLFGIFKRKKQPEEQPSNPQGEAKTTMPTAGTVVGGAAASSSGFSDQSTTTPSQAVADTSEPEPVAGNTISQQEDTFQPDSTQTVAQTDSTPSYSTEEPALNIPEESTETVNAPEGEGYQSGSTEGSTEEPKLPPDSSPPQLPDDGSASSEDSSDSPGSDDQSVDDSTGPSIG
ncbi:MAG: hypothetical protein WD885_00740 [Candidatus Saccharimonadales bacterium]